MDGSKITAKQWPRDNLNRTDEGRHLIEYLNALYGDKSDEALNGSFVMNLNAPWGYGKTFFLENIYEDLKEAKHPIVYFDAWANDYSETPLLSFISEIQSALKPYAEKTPEGKRLLNSVVSSGKKIIGTLTGVGLNILAKKLTGFSSDELIEELGDKLGDKAESIVDMVIEKSINDHDKLKGLVENFKKELEQLVEELANSHGYKLPMYILIDELDRCRPNFAVELLENIKHIFNSQGVFFIIATNKAELVNSIKAIYGGEFDSFNYLKRFFNQEYDLSIPDNYGFILGLFDKYRISDEKLYCPLNDKVNNTNNILAFVLSKLAVAYKLGLRDLEQICIQLKSILLTCSEGKLHYLFLIYLLVTKHKGLGVSTLRLISTNELTKTDFKTFQRNEYHDLVPIGLSYNDILDYYYKFTNINNRGLAKLNGSGNNTFKEDVYGYFSDAFRNLHPFMPLSQYDILVNQAGRIGNGSITTN